MKPSGGTVNPRPLLLGHRGHRLGRLWRRQRTRMLAPPAAVLAEIENTRPAFDRALAAGCDGLELDLHQTADGHLVIHHDLDLQGRLIALTRLTDLRRLQPELMTLPVFLRRYGSRAWLDIEIKGRRLEPALVEVLRRIPPTRGYVVSSFRPRVLQRMAELAPEIPLCLNLKRPVSLRKLKSLPIAWVAPHERLCTRWYVNHLHAGGWQVLVWTVNRIPKMRMLARAGVAVLVSDDPATLVTSVDPFRQES